MKLKLKILNKVIAILVVACFFATSVCRDAVAVATMPAVDATQYKQIFTDFILPYSYGKITKSHFAGTDRVVINIQDLHCHPQVQKNISNIIEMFDKKYGVTNVYLEGAYGDVSTKWLTENIKNDKKKSEILNKILDTGKLTGAEYYSAASDKTEIIKGLEKKEPYLDNLKRFGDLLEKQDEIQIILKWIEESTAKVKKQYYTKRQYKIEELSKEYITGEMRPEKYYKLLSKHTEKLGIDLTKYENTYTYIKLLALQKQLDYKAITSQLQALVMILKEKLPYNAYKMLLDNTKNFEQTDKLYSYIIKLSKDIGLDVSANFKELNKYFNYIELSQKINPLDLLKEEERLTREINTRFSDTVAQREVVFLTHFEKYLKDYMSTKITSDDYEYYKENIETYKRLYNKYVDNKVFSLLKPYMDEVDTFYKINMDRNDYFTENLFDGIETYEIENIKEEPKETNKIIENMDKVTRLDVIVTGGFHSQTVTEILQDQGVSYIVITPNVQGGVKEAEKTYYEIAKEQKEINFQTLATMPLTLLGKEKTIEVLLLTPSYVEKDLIEQFGEKAVRDAKVRLEKLTETEKNERKEYAIQIENLKKEIATKLESDDPNIEDIEKLAETVGLSENLKNEEIFKVMEEVVSIINNGDQQEKSFFYFFNILQSDKRRSNVKTNAERVVNAFEYGVDIVETFIDASKLDANKDGLKYSNDKGFYYVTKETNEVVTLKNTKNLIEKEKTSEFSEKTNKEVKNVLDEEQEQQTKQEIIEQINKQPKLTDAEEQELKEMKNAFDEDLRNRKRELTIKNYQDELKYEYMKDIRGEVFVNEIVYASEYGNYYDENKEKIDKLKRKLDGLDKGSEEYNALKDLLDFAFYMKIIGLSSNWDDNENKNANEAEIKMIIQDKSLDIKYRLFALAYFGTKRDIYKVNYTKKNGEKVDVIKDLKETFIADVKNGHITIGCTKYENENTVLGNDFDLRAVSAGIFLMEEDMLSEYFYTEEEENKKHRKEIFNSISKSMFINEDEDDKVAANSSLVYGSSFFIDEEGKVDINKIIEYISHEVGHRFQYDFFDYGTKEDKEGITSFLEHFGKEFFAEICCVMVCQELGMDCDFITDCSYKVYNNKKDDEKYLAQDEYSAGRGLIYLLEAFFYENKEDVDYALLAKTVADVLKFYFAPLNENEEKEWFIKNIDEVDDSFFDSFDVNISNQSVMIKNILELYFLNLEKKSNKEKKEKIKDIKEEIKEKDSWKALIPELFQEIYDYDKDLFENIIEKIKDTQTNEEGKIKISPYGTETHEDLDLENNKQVIVSIVLSQPNNIVETLNIILSQILIEENILTENEIENLMKDENLTEEEKCEELIKELSKINNTKLRVLIEAIKYGYDTTIKEMKENPKTPVFISAKEARKKGEENLSNTFLPILSPQKINEKVKNRFGDNSLFYKITNWFAQHENFYVTFIAPLWEEGVFGLGALGISFGLSFVFAGPVIPLIGFFIWRVIVFSIAHIPSDVEEFEDLKAKGETEKSKFNFILGRLGYRLAGSAVLSIPYMIPFIMPMSAVMPFVAPIGGLALGIYLHKLFNEYASEHETIKFKILGKEIEIKTAIFTLGGEKVGKDETEAVLLQKDSEPSLNKEQKEQIKEKLESYGNIHSNIYNDVITLMEYSPDENGNIEQKYINANNAINDFIYGDLIRVAGISSIYVQYEYDQLKKHEVPVSHLFYNDSKQFDMNFFIAEKDLENIERNKLRYYGDLFEQIKNRNQETSFSETEIEKVKNEMGIDNKLEGLSEKEQVLFVTKLILNRENALKEIATEIYAENKWDDFVSKFDLKTEDTDKLNEQWEGKGIEIKENKFINIRLKEQNEIEIKTEDGTVVKLAKENKDTKEGDKNWKQKGWKHICEGHSPLMNCKEYTTDGTPTGLFSSKEALKTIPTLEDICYVISQQGADELKEAKKNNGKEVEQKNDFGKNFQFKLKDDENTNEIETFYIKGEILAENEFSDFLSQFKSKKEIKQYKSVENLLKEHPEIIDKWKTETKELLNIILSQENINTQINMLEEFIVLLDIIEERDSNKIKIEFEEAIRKMILDDDNKYVKLQNLFNNIEQGSEDSELQKWIEKIQWDIMKELEKPSLKTDSTVNILEGKTKEIEGRRNKLYAYIITPIRKIVEYRYRSNEEKFKFRDTTTGILIGAILEWRDIFKILRNEDYKKEFLKMHKEYNSETQGEYEKTLEDVIEKTKEEMILATVVTTAISLLLVALSLMSPLLIFILPVIGIFASLIIPHAKVNRDEIKKTLETEKYETEQKIAYRNEKVEQSQNISEASTNSLKNVLNPMKLVNKISEYFANKAIIEQINGEEIAFIKKEDENNIAEKSDKVRYYSIGEKARHLVHTKVGVIYVKDGKVVDESEEGATPTEIRLAVNKNNEYIFYSNTTNIGNIDNIDLVIEGLMDKFRNEGVKTNLFNDNTIFAFPNTDKKVLTETDIENSINNKQSSYVMPAETIKYTFEDEEEINERICKGIKDKTGITTFVVSKQQYEKVKQLKDYSFIVKETDINDAFKNIEENQGDVFIDLSSQKYSKETAKKELEEIRKNKLATKQGVNLAVTVKFSNDTYEELKDINIFEEYGIIPIVEAKNKDMVKGKKEIDNITGIKELENKADIIGYIFNEKDVEVIEKEAKEVIGGIKTIIENIKSSIKGNSQKQYNKGHAAALKNNDDYKLNNSNDVTSNEDLKELLQMNSKDVEELLKWQGEEQIIKIIKENLSLFNPQAQSYISEELLAKGKYIEAIGFIFGVVENSIADEIATKFGLDGIKEMDSNEKQAIFMVIIGKMINGQPLEKIIGDDAYENGTKDATLTEIREGLNLKLDEVLRTGIPKNPKEADGFDGIIALLTDYKEIGVVGKAEIAATRNLKAIFAAA